MELLRHAVWYLCLPALIAYGVFLLLDGVVNADTKRGASTVVVRDVLKKDAHNLSGTVMVPSPCHQLIAHTKQIDPSNYLLAFDTWEDPSRVCTRDLVPRTFHLTLFAPPTGVAFQGTFNDRPIALEVVKTEER